MFVTNRLGLTDSIESMLAQEQRLNQVTNNLANADTTGFKKDAVSFQEMLYQASANRQRVGKGLKILTDHGQGVVRMTGNPLDMAIAGEGFFRVQTAQGVRYTRAGNFQLNGEGQLVMPNGNQVLGDNGPIVLTSPEFTVDAHGRILVDGNQVGQLSIVTVDDLKMLEKEGESLFRLKEGGQEVAAQNFTLKQGFLEQSNVNTVEEMTEMIEILRAYEGQQKMIRALDELDDLAVRRVGVLNP